MAFDLRCCQVKGQRNELDGAIADMIGQRDQFVHIVVQLEDQVRSLVVEHQQMLVSRREMRDVAELEEKLRSERASVIELSAEVQVCKTRLVAADSEVKQTLNLG